MTKARKRGLLIYGVVVLIALILIMFVIPDSAFRKLYEKNIEKVQNSFKKMDFIDYKEQVKRLLNKRYEYKYLTLDSLGKESIMYNCTGILSDKTETGNCTSPETFSYTEKNKKELFKTNINYLDANYIFENIIKDAKPEETKYQTTREYKYNTTIEKLDTEIIVYTDYENITSIEISNAYMTYVLKYSNIFYEE